MAFFRRNTSFWYNGYIFQGFVILGVLPVLLPIFVSEAFSPDKIGAIVAAVYIGQLSAPLLGNFADYSKRYALVFLSGYVLIGIGFISFLFWANFFYWFVLAMLIGIGSAATNTVGGMYIVELFPEPQWDRRIGWMQTYYGFGQTLGIFAMIYFQAYPALSMAGAGLLMLPGLMLSLFRLPLLQKTTAKKPECGHQVVRGAQSATSQYHQSKWKTFTKWVSKWDSLFTLFLFSWFIIMIGVWTVFNLYPLLMKQSFGLSFAVSSLYLAVGAAVGVLAYPYSGYLAQKSSNSLILFLAGVISFISAGILLYFALFPSGLGLIFVALAIIVITMAWSPFIVTGTALAAELAIVPKGEALGLLNSSTAFASILSAFFAGLLAQHVGYNAVIISALGLILLGTVVFLPILFKRAKCKSSKSKDSSL